MFRLAVAFVVLALSSAVASAAGLPLKPGSYAPGSAAEVAAEGQSCLAPDNLRWNGRGFEADYVYIDNVVETQSLGPSRYRLKSLTRTKDDNVRQSGKVWFAEVEIVSASEFLFKQYSAKDSPASDPPQRYGFCSR